MLVQFQNDTILRHVVVFAMTCTLRLKYSGNDSFYYLDSRMISIKKFEIVWAEGCYECRIVFRHSDMIFSLS